MLGLQSKISYAFRHHAIINKYLQYCIIPVNKIKQLILHIQAITTPTKNIHHLRCMVEDLKLFYNYRMINRMPQTLNQSLIIAFNRTLRQKIGINIYHFSADFNILLKCLGKQ